MKFRLGPKAALCLLSAGLTLGAAPAALAQHDGGQVAGPSKYLYLSNAEIKPAMESVFVQNESSEVQALREANSKAYYFGMMNITGAPRSLFFRGYDSFAEMQQNHEQLMSNAKLEDTLRADDAAEAPALAGHTGSIYEYRKDLSLNAAVDLSQMRFFDITLFHVRSGHEQDWERLVKLYMKAYSSAPNVHWAVFEKMYGVGSDNSFILCIPMKSLADEDQAIVTDKNLPKTVGEDQMQLMRELGSVTVESSESDLFALVPKISYAPDSWLKASPDFWGRK